MDNAITRNEAIEFLYELMDNSAFSEEVLQKLADIANAIENEKYGLHMWGADKEEYALLVTSVREDLQTEAYIENLQKVWGKYTFAPSAFEEQEIIDNLTEAAEE